jgi:hypothetical protein
LGPAGEFRHNLGVATSPGTGCKLRVAMDKIRNAKYQIGQIVRHRLYPFRGVVFDVDPVFDNTEEWYQAIPAQGSAVLSFVRRERRNRIRRLRLGAKPIARQ